MSVTCKVERISPHVARKMLKQNTGNFRVVDKARIKNYAREMVSGNWDMNGETVKFNGSVLLDGQHRLYAVIESGVTIDMLVVRGLTTNALHIDRGKPRTMGQWLKHEGVKNASAIAAVTRLSIIHDRGLWSQTGVGIDGVTDSESIAFAKEHADVMQAALQGPRVLGISRSVLCAILFLGSGKSEQHEYAVWFRNALATGSDLSDTDPALHLRNQLSQQSRNKRLTPFLCRMLATLAWNKTVEGSECKVLRVRISGPKKEALPRKVLVAETA